jgi:hypothetical protein
MVGLQVRCSKHSREASVALQAGTLVPSGPLNPEENHRNRGAVNGGYKLIHLHGQPLSLRDGLEPQSR